MGALERDRPGHSPGLFLFGPFGYFTRLLARSNAPRIQATVYENLKGMLKDE